MKRFEIGKVYIWPALFISSFPIKVTGRNENNIIFEELGFPEEKMYHAIEHDKEGNEIIKAWEYQGEVGYIRA